MAPLVLILSLLLTTSIAKGALAAIPALPPDAIIGTGEVGSCKEKDFDRALDILNDWGRTASGMVDGDSIPMGSARPVRILFDCGPPPGEAVISFTTEKQINFFVQGSKKFEVHLIIEGKCGSAPVVFDGRGSIRLFKLEVKVKGLPRGSGFIADSWGGGGVHLELKNVALRNGAARGDGWEGDGGCMFGHENSRLSLSGVRFNSCTASGDGGGIAMKSGMMMVRDTVFEECSSGNLGGAISLDDVKNGAWATVEQTRFTRNGAGGSGGGGAIYLRGKDDATRRASVWGRSMTTMLTAGATSIQSGEFIFKDCEFTGNTLSKNGVTGESGTGGAMLIKQTNSKLLSLQDILFHSNVAANGGGALHTQNVAQVNANNVYFVRNDVGYDGDTHSDKMGLGGGWRVNKCQIDAHNVVFSGNIGLVGGAFSWDHAWQNRGHLLLQDAVFEKTQTREYSALNLWSVPNRTLINMAFCQNHAENGQKASSFSNIRACDPAQISPGEKGCDYEAEFFDCLYDGLTFGKDTWGSNAKLRTATWPVGKGSETCRNRNVEWLAAGENGRECTLVCDGSNPRCEPRNLIFDVCTGIGTSPTTTFTTTTAPPGWHLVVSTGYALTSGIFTSTGQQQNGQHIFQGPFGSRLRFEVRSGSDGPDAINWGARVWLKSDGWTITGGPGGHHKYGLPIRVGIEDLCDQSSWQTREWVEPQVSITGCRDDSSIGLTTLVATTTRTTPGSTKNDITENAPGVGGWGGSCTCQDGTVFQVGDNGDSCKSLACIGGTAGTCNRRTGIWSNRKVVCGQGNTNTIVATTSRPTTSGSLSNHVVENAPGVGGWGGSCTCPDGSVFQVGDNGDFCKSLACIGGTAGTCNRRTGIWSKRKVVCGQGNTNTVVATTSRPTTSGSLSNHVVENAPGVGGWGGSCTCPDGSVFQVGDNGDFCKSLACIGGTAGTCNRRTGSWSKRKVVCAHTAGGRRLTRLQEETALGAVFV